MSLTESDRVLKAIEILMNYFIRLCVFACGHEGVGREFLEAGVLV